MIGIVVIKDDNSKLLNGLKDFINILNFFY